MKMALSELGFHSIATVNAFINTQMPLQLALTWAFVTYKFGLASLYFIEPNLALRPDIVWGRLSATYTESLPGSSGLVIRPTRDDVGATPILTCSHTASSNSPRSAFGALHANEHAQCKWFPPIAPTLSMPDSMTLNTQTENERAKYPLALDVDLIHFFWTTEITKDFVVPPI